MSDIEKRLEKLETEVRALQDHRDIMQLIVSYGPTVDTAQTVELSKRVADIWTEDGIYEVGGMPQTEEGGSAGGGFAQFEGRHAIEHMFEGQHFEMVPEGIAHIMMTPYIRIKGDTAKAISYSTVFRPEGDHFYPWRVSVNIWNVVRVDGKWKAKRRTNTLMRGTPEALALVRTIDELVEGQR